jgi:hypothetical protein
MDKIIGVIASILSIVNAIALIILGILQHRENVKQRKELQWRDNDIEELKKIVEPMVRIEDNRRRHRKNLDDYYCKIAQEFEYIVFGGLRNSAIEYLEMEKVYVKQQVEYKPPRAVQARNSLKKALKEDFQTAFENLCSEYKGQDMPLKLIIRGPAGSGKTTLLKWIAIQCIPPRKNFLSGFIPILIPLKNLALSPDNTFRSNNLKELSIAHLNTLNISPSLVDDSFEDDKVIFLFDGLDEVTDKNIRREILDWILSQNTGRNPLLVTTRESGLQDIRGLNILPPITVCTLMEFETREILQFLDNWCENIEKGLEIVEEKKKINHENTREIVLKADKKCSNLKKIIHTDPSLFQLAKNPLLLTIIAVLQINRDQLKWPMEQHELYEECLKLMIELNDNSSSRADPGPVADIYMEYLSYIALFLLENNCSEIEPSQIRNFLPMPVEKNQFESFLNDMSQKTGLLYESGNKYGFANIIFQEYLAARYLARLKTPTDILEYQDKYNCSEITKLYVNTIDKESTKEFFNIIIENLVRKNYWKQIWFWEDCLLNAGDKSVQESIEIRFAERVLEILQEIAYKENNVEIIISLCGHYPLFKHAQRFMDEALDLLKDAKHPIAQSVGSSILNSGDEKYRALLMQELKNRIDNFDIREDISLRQSFLYRDSNSFPLLIYGRKNVLDFFYVLAKLKTKNLFLIFLILLHLESLWYILDSTELLKLPGLKELLEFLDIRELLQRPELPVDLDVIVLRDLLTLQGFMEFRGIINVRDFIECQYYNKFQGLIDEFDNKYRDRLEELKEEIDTWSDKAAARLYPLPDEKILDFFPGTTNEDLKIFREKVT